MLRHASLGGLSWGWGWMHLCLASVCVYASLGGMSGLPAGGCGCFLVCISWFWWLSRTRRGTAWHGAAWLVAGAPVFEKAHLYLNFLFFVVDKYFNEFSPITQGDTEAGSSKVKPLSIIELTRNQNPIRKQDTPAGLLHCRSFSGASVHKRISSI